MLPGYVKLLNRECKRWKYACQKWEVLIIFDLNFKVTAPIISFRLFSSFRVFRNLSSLPGKYKIKIDELNLSCGKVSLEFRIGQKLEF